MSTRFHRRRFLKQAAAVAGAAAGSRLFGVPALLAQRSPNSTLGTAVIGCFNQGKVSLAAAAAERLVALVDVDESHFRKARKFIAKNYPDLDISGAKEFFDYRQMFDKMHKDVDAVFVATPDHHHAVASIMAMKLGKHVYVEKPMAHSIAEVRAMHETARQYKVATQLGNQGHSGEGVRRFCEYIWAGAIGNVLEVYAWAPTGRGSTGGRLPTKPVPKGLHWEEWIGPAEYRDYHDELHPILWRSWWEFGDASVGDWGCHNLDGAYTALKLGAPSSVEVLVQEGGSQERYPLINVIRWEFPAREGMSPVKVHWYDGYHGAKGPDFKDEEGKPVGEQNRPAIVAELEKKYGIDLKNGGTVYVGDKGVMYSDNYCHTMRILPEEKHQAFPVPEKKFPRIKGTHQANFLRACKGGPAACSNFDYAAGLNEIVLLGCLAIRAGLGKKVQWDPVAMTCPGMPELDPLIKRQYRKGWEL